MTSYFFSFLVLFEDVVFFDFFGVGDVNTGELDVLVVVVLSNGWNP
ncbi:hypothetical protein LM500065_80596 [Listeria monocytogenes]|nr:hypothetical protein LM500065_80596 [Listeria monocytogenes]CUL58912.1 hypothetical protein LM800235_40212 [Listeria monocytogenes]